MKIKFENVGKFYYKIMYKNKYIYYNICSKNWQFVESEKQATPFYNKKEIKEFLYYSGIKGEEIEINLYINE